MPWIKECLESIYRQNLDDWEIIIRDDGSTDGTRDYLRELKDDRIRVVLAARSNSVAENWTEVSKLASKDFTKIICQDDLVMGDCFEKQISVLQANPKSSMVASLHQVIDSEGKVLIKKHGLSQLKGTLPGSAALQKSVAAGANDFGEPASVMFRTNALKASLPFDPEYPYLTDLDMYRKVLNRGDFIAIPEVHAAFRLSPNSWSQDLAKVQSKEFVSWIRGVFNQGPGKLSWLNTHKAIALIRVRTFVRRIFVLANTKKSK